jgi:poly(hydroxyalkanoate) depolymerase family esterase
MLKDDDNLTGRGPDVTPEPLTLRPHHRVDVGAITDTIQRALTAAGLNTQSGPMKGVTDTIEQALSAAGLMQQPSAASARGETFDGVAREIVVPVDHASIVALQDKPGPAPTEPASRGRPAPPGEFVTRTYANATGRRAYKLYVPARYSADASDPVPMVVMLHGCTQSPDDFATGTRMNTLADEHGFLVVYPAQAANANGSKCWNWFRSQDQHRDGGEPSLIAGITREIASTYRVDERRIFVAGLSAGAAMAVILGATYPDLYAAVGAHSGLPYGAAQDLPSAFGAMKAACPPLHVDREPCPQCPRSSFMAMAMRRWTRATGAAIVAQAVADRPDDRPLQASTEEGVAVGGRRYRRTVHSDAGNQPVVEEWVLHGAGHAWSGGSPNGSFTDAGGPDASAEMIRFFLSLPRAGTA